MRELTIFIGSAKSALSQIEKLKDEVLELFALIKQDGKDDIYYKYSIKNGEFLKYNFKSFDGLSDEISYIKGPILFIETIKDDNTSIDAFLKQNQKIYMLEYLEQLENNNESLSKDALKEIEKSLKKYEEMAEVIEKEIKHLNLFLDYKEFFDDKKENLMYEIKKTNFNSLKDKIMLFFKGIKGGKNRKNYKALITNQDLKKECCNNKECCDNKDEVKECDSDKDLKK
ncbi:hypothetical protein CUREO_1062 [Campylobacter ureolyticus RIGS 9880]|uniref:Uncharacterized protein n=1 Tax=Campylobacter ureolyticus RIGS 9880 TaxID=1032069 RepID=A0AAU8U1N0_9BACT|nr:hypothetical protein [Campylobacter ureolyticus]AKT90911.1 hypothetical protein CUREO_1062 [Campylobacter ureolyticus RIGS 9880]